MALRILVRFDDICPTMDFTKFQKAVELMDSYGVKPLIGVIPDCQDPDLMIEPPHDDFWDYIKTLYNKGYAIAMHGYQHIFDSPHHGIVENRMESEFAGHSYQVQFEKLRKGKEILVSHGIDTDVFFAPAHSYDINTIKALSHLDFKYISDGKSSKPYELYGIKFLPCRSGGCPRIGAKGMYTAVFHAHEWAKSDKMKDYAVFVNLLNNHAEHIVPFYEYASAKSSSAPIQIFIERMFVFYTCNIRPLLSSLLHKSGLK